MTHLMSCTEKGEPMTEIPSYGLTLVTEPGDRRDRAAVRVLADLSEVPVPDIEVVSVRIQIPEHRDGVRTTFRDVFSVTEPLAAARASVTTWRDQAEEVGQ